MSKKARGYLVLAIIILGMAWLYSHRAQAQTAPDSSYSCIGPDNKLFFTAPVTPFSAWRCMRRVGIGTWPQALLRLDYFVNGVKKRQDVRLYASVGQGIFTWEAPTTLENGNILTDLDHYLLFRQAGVAPATVVAQIDGRAKKLLIPMTTTDFGACFWFVSVRKPATSPPVASDKSNSICLDANGLTIPKA